jgi:hypothetical protein
MGVVAATGAGAGWVRAFRTGGFAGIVGFACGFEGDDVFGLVGAFRAVAGFGAAAGFDFGFVAAGLSGFGSAAVFGFAAAGVFRLAADTRFGDAVFGVPAAGFAVGLAFGAVAALAFGAVAALACGAFAAFGAVAAFGAFAAFGAVAAFEVERPLEAFRGVGPGADVTCGMSGAA